MASQTLLIRIQGDPSAFKTAMTQVRAEVDKTGASVQAVSGKLESFGSKLSGIGSALTVGVTAPVLAMAAGAVKAATDLDSLQRGLSATMKSSEGATREMAKLREVARLPGLGLEEAVSGSIRLQTLGVSADKARRIMSEFGNALSIAGGTKADFGEAIRQLSQLAAVGKVTKENLDPIIERIPAVAAIIKEKFGPEALGDPAKVFQQLGIDSAKFIDIITNELAKLERSTGGPKAALENLTDTIKESAARIGDKLLPAVTAAIPKIEGMVIAVAGLADGFIKLPEPIKNATLLITGLVVAAGPVAAVVGRIAAAITGLKGVIASAGIATGIAGLFGAATVMMISETIGAINRLDARWADAMRDQERRRTGRPDLIPGGGDTPLGRTLGPEYLPDQMGQAGNAARKLKLDLGDLGKEYDALVRPKSAVIQKTGELTSAVGVGSAAVESHSHKIKELARETLNSILFHERARDIQNEYNKRIHEAGEILQRYGTVSIETAIALARTADEQFRLNRALEEAPDMGWWKTSIPKPSSPDMPGDFGEFERTARNIGELGMQTKEQYDAMRRAATQSGREQSRAMRQVSTVITDLSRGLARNIIEWKGWKDTAIGVVKNLGEAIIRTLIEGALTKLAAKLLNVSGLFGKVFGGGTGAVMSAAGGGAASAGGTAASSASSAAGAAASSVTGIISAVTGVISAVSDVISNFQLAKIEKTLNAIEKSTRYTQIYTGEQSDSLLHTSHASLKYVQMIAANTKGMVGINIQGAITGDQTNDLINRLVDGSNSFWLDTYRVLKNIEEITRSGFAGVIGPLNRMANPSLLSRLLGGGGGGFGPLGGGVGGGVLSGIGVIGAAATGGIGSIVGGLLPNRQEGSLNAIEANTRKATIYIGEQSQSLLWCAQKTTEYVGYAVTALDAIGRFNSEMLGNLQQMNQRGLAGAGAGGTQISFTNCTFGAGMTQTSAEAIFRQAIGDLKRKGINP